jgi:hypothetical protein
MKVRPYELACSVGYLSLLCSRTIRSRGVTRFVTPHWLSYSGLRSLLAHKVSADFKDLARQNISENSCPRYKIQRQPGSLMTHTSFITGFQGGTFAIG